MTRLLIMLLILMMCLGNSCSGIQFDPDFYLPNIHTENIVNEDGRKIHMLSREMLEFGCMHQDKIEELAELLQRHGQKERASKVFNLRDKILNNQSN